jgi:hypothetical protein
MSIRPSGVIPAWRKPSTSILMTATLLVLAVVAAGRPSHIRPENHVAQISTDLSDRTSYSSSDQDLLRARIGFARKIGNL